MKGIIDANLLLVLVVGLNDPRLLGRKKHVAEYCKEDFDVLYGVLNDFDRLLVTPNIITECSNLICGKDGHGANSSEATILAELLDEGAVYRLDERYVESVVAANRNEYRYLGVGDCSLLHLVDAQHAVVTADGALARAAQSINHASVNFNHVRTGALLY